MQLAQVIETSATVAATRSRNEKVAAIAATLRDASSTGAPVEVVADHLAGVLPQRRIGVSWRGLRDLPEPAAESTLTVAEVDAALTRIGRLRGPGSSARRHDEVAALFARATADEQPWLRSLITGEMRQGASDGVMLKAIAAAADVPEQAVRRAVMLAGFAGPVARAALVGGAAALAEIRLEVGRPLRPMLAGSAPDIPTAMTGQPVALDSKLDGIRIQAHVRHGEVTLFTRTLDDVTARLPEVVDALAALDVDQAVLDGEVIAERDGRPEPFQVTGSRTMSSADPDRMRDEVPLTTYFFDLLHLDGRDLVDVPAAQRWELLSVVAPGHVVPRVVTDDVSAAQAFFDERIAAGHEGVVVKDRAAPYAAGRRGAGWVKVKPRHTLDLVVLAVEWGSGRRRGKLSNIHLGARDASGGFVMLGKTFKGMTDETLAWQTERFLSIETHHEGHVVHVRPEQLVEIAFDGVQRSTRYPGGVALRFARVLRYRDDKPVEEADTIESVRALL